MNDPGVIEHGVDDSYDAGDAAPHTAATFLSATNIWLTELPGWLAAAGLHVTTWPGWATRARSSGGYDSILGIGVHHTASATGGRTIDVCRYAWDTAPSRPVGAIVLGRDGDVVVGAAGATNTQGQGGPYTTSKGTIPLDSGNRHMVSIEACNDGVGEPWPRAQQDAYVLLCSTLCRHLDLDPLRDVIAHFQWAPGRKIDPAGQSDYATGSSMWAMPAFRRDVAANATGDDDMTPIEPTRVYDTRANVRPDGTPIPFGGGKFAAGETRRISVALAQSAYIHVSAGEADGPGYVAVSSDGAFAGGTSLVNYEVGRWSHDGAPVLCPGGLLYVRVLRACHVTIDTYATG